MPSVQVNDVRGIDDVPGLRQELDMLHQLLRAAVGAATPPLHHILVIGQSNANGGGTVALSTSTPTFSPQPLMFNGGTRPGGTGLTSLVPLVESTGGAQSGAETICSGMARQLAVLQPSRQFVFSVAARDGTRYLSLKKGTAAYSDALAQVTAAKAIAESRQQPYSVAALCLLHGETDIDFNNTNYAANLLEWQTDFNGDIKAITGQSQDIPMFACQQSYRKTDAETSQTAYNVYQAWKTSPASVVLLGARYTYGCQTGTQSSLHISSHAQRWHGGLYAEAISARVFNSVDWKPLTPIAGQVTLSGSTVVVNLNVPQPPVRIMHDYVGRVGANHGFTFWDDSGSPPTVTDVSVSGPSQLTLTLSAAPTGTVGSRRVRYAWGAGTLSSQSGPYFGTIRGSICDTEVRSSQIDGLPMRNWMAIFEESVS